LLVAGDLAALPLNRFALVELFWSLARAPYTRPQIAAEQIRSLLEFTVFGQVHDGISLSVP